MCLYVDLVDIFPVEIPSHEFCKVIGPNLTTAL